jgi:hypothetical protein
MAPGNNNNRKGVYFPMGLPKTPDEPVDNWYDRTIAAYQKIESDSNIELDPATP